jgi:hypothetical protein
MTIHEAHRLNELEEARGQLLKVLELEGFAVAVFAWGAISLPTDMAGRLSELIGHKIACIKLDGQYRVKVI